MTGYMCLIFTVLMQVLVSLTQDIPPSVSCNMELLSWNEAVANCRNKGGKMLSFRTGIGKDVDELDLKSEFDVWTADYLTPGSTEDIILCGFNHLNSTQYYNPDVLYGDCNANRNYFCKNGTGHLVVNNGTKENIHCSYNISLKDIQSHKSVITSGFYWKFETTTGTEVKGTGTNFPNLCGAYSRYIGKHYVNCYGQRYSLCSETGSNKWTGQIDTQCFGGHTTKKITEETKLVTKTEQLTTGSSKISTKSSSVSRTEQSITAVLTSVENMSSEDKIQTKEESTDIGIKVGLPVGIMLPVICGVFIGIYIYRKRIKCWQSCKETHENGQINHFHTQETLQIHSQANVYNESSQGTPISSDTSAEYAVVMKPKKDKMSSISEKYSEKTSHNLTYDEYDTTINFQSVTSNSSNNVYNHFGSDDYNSASVLRRQGERNDMYDITTRSNLVESSYDSTTQVNGTRSCDDVYNHLSQNMNYYDTSTNTRNNR